MDIHAKLWPAIKAIVGYFLGKGIGVGVGIYAP